MSNERWDDFALDERFKHTDARLERIDDVIKAVSALPHAMAVMERRHEEFREWMQDIESRTQEDINEVKQSVREVRDSCQAIRTEIQGAAADRNKARVTITVALIGGSATVLAALVALVGVLLTQ